MNLTLLLLNILLFSVLAITFKQWTKSFPLHRYFYPVLSLKLLVGLAVGGVYQYLYNGEGDTFSLYQDAEQIADFVVKHEDAWEFMINDQAEDFAELYQELANKNPRALIMSKLIAVVHLISQNYWLSSCYFSFFSFVGIWYFANTLIRIWPSTKIAVVMAFLLLPSFVFWTSGLLKESVLAACLYLLMAWQLEAVVRKKTAYKWLKLLFAIPLLYLIFQMKYYYLAAFLPCVCLFMIMPWLDRAFQGVLWKKYLTLGGLFLLMLVLASYVHPNLSLTHVSAVIVQNNLKMAAETTNEQALLHFHDLKNEPVSLLYNAAIGFWEGAFRPYIWEKGHLFWKLTGIENLLVFFLMIFALGNLLLGKVKLLKNNNNVLIVSVLYVLLLAVLLPLAAPNLGNLARYKTGYFPIIVYLMLCACQLHRFPYTRT